MERRELPVGECRWPNRAISNVSPRCLPTHPSHTLTLLHTQENTYYTHSAIYYYYYIFIPHCITHNLQGHDRLKHPTINLRRSTRQYPTQCQHRRPGYRIRTITTSMSILPRPTSKMRRSETRLRTVRSIRCRVPIHSVPTGVQRPVEETASESVPGRPTPRIGIGIGIRRRCHIV